MDSLSSSTFLKTHILMMTCLNNILHGEFNPCSLEHSASSTYSSSFEEYNLSSSLILALMKIGFDLVLAQAGHIRTSTSATQSGPIIN